jgi:uncharacterized protein (TIGR03437 family)
MAVWPQVSLTQASLTMTKTTPRPLLSRIRKAGAVLFLAASLAPKPVIARQDPVVCGSHPDKNQEEMALHRAWRNALALKPEGLRRAGVAAAARDIGNIAVLEDSEGVVSRRNDFNLDRRQVRFTPVQSGARYQFDVSDAGYDAAAATTGAPVAIGDDDSRGMPLPFAFPYYGQVYTQLFLNSDGNLTFGEADTSTNDRSISRATSGPPRIAALYRDMDPSVAANSVRVLSEPGRWVVSWVAVPEYSPSGFGVRQTFQIRLFPNGRIEIAFSGVTTQSAVVGISPGNLQGISSLVAFTRGSSQEYTGAILERFTAIEEVDIVFASQKFYETHEDAYDFLVIYNNMGIDAAPGAVAYEVSVRNDRLGIGDLIVDDGKEFGSARRLQAVLNLGPLSQYPRDPNAVVPSRSASRDTPLTILGHESGHLWLAFASVREPGNLEARPMLGRQGAHWSFTFNSEASLLEGNRIQDSGPTARPRFRTVATVEGYAPLDQYLMGFRPPEEVPPTFVVTEATTGPSNRQPQSGVSFDGNRRDIDIQQIVEVEGRRVPDHTVSQRRFRLGFLLVTAAGTEPSAEQLAQLDDYRQRFEEFFNRATGGRAFAETRLQRSLRLSVSPYSGLLAGTTASATVMLSRPAEAPLNVSLRSQSGLVSLPASVTIGAGQTEASFTVRGEGSGVDELIAEPSDSRYAEAYARLQVNADSTALVLAVYAGNKQKAVSGTPLASPVVLRVVDRNNVPYPGVSVSAAVTQGGTVTPSTAVADADGYVRFQWTPGGGQLHELRATVAGNPNSTVLVTALGRATLTAAGVVNAASFTAGLSPGSLASAFGINLAGGALSAASLPLPVELSGVRVLLNGRAAPLLYISDRQINFLVPNDTATGEAELVVSFGSGSAADATNPVRVPVRALDPGIFFQAETGLGAILVAGTGKTTVDRAAAVGDVLEIYCTGLGRLALNPSSGLSETAVRPQVRIAGRDAEVLFSGAAPGFVGLYQVNARVPAGTPGGAQGVSIRQESAASNEVRVLIAQ